MTVDPEAGHRTRLIASPPVPRSESPIPVRLRHLALLFAALVACTRVPRDVAPPVPAGVGFTDGTIRYGVVEHRHVEQRYQDRPIVTDATTSLVLATTFTQVDSGFLVDLVLDSIFITGDAGLSPAAVTAAVGVHLEGRITPDRPALMIMTPDAANPVLDQLVLDLHGLFPALPPGAATPGLEWADSVTFHGRTGDIPITLTAHAVHRAGAWSDFEGRQVLDITSETRYSLSGEGDRMGQWISMHGDGAASAEHLLTAGGTIALGVRRDSLRVEVEVQTAGMVIPILQTRVDTVRQVQP